MTAYETVLFVEFRIMIGTVLANKVSFGTTIIEAAADYLFYLALMEVYAWSKLGHRISLMGLTLGLV
jgi:hypothetical protein